MVIVVPYQEVFYRTLEMKFLTAVLIILFIIGMFITWGYVIYIRKKKYYNLKKLAYTDELCNVQNYNGFIRDGEGLAQNNLAKKYAVLYLDIDDFKMINHLYGFDYGNEVLKNLVLIFKNVFGGKCGKVLMFRRPCSASPMASHWVLEAGSGWLSTVLTLLATTSVS